MITAMTTGEMQHAAKLIEVDGVEALQTVTQLYGRDIAMVLLVAHIRRGEGSMDSYPSDPGIDARVEEVLRRNNLE